MLKILEKPQAKPQGPRAIDNPGSSIGRMLLDQGKITPEEAERVLRVQKELGLRFGEAAQKLGLITEDDIQQVLSQQFDYPYLQPGQGGLSSELVAAYQPFSAQVETFRAVRSQLVLRWFSQGHRALVVAAVDSGDGASYAAANLGIVFSQLGERTLLIDANLRTPRQHVIFNLASRSGLSDVLASRADLTAINCVGDLESLSVLGAGTPPPNPQELINRPPFAALNRAVSSTYDVTLYDVPSFNAGADALSIAAAVGGVLLVTRCKHTRWADVAKTCQQVRNAGAEVVGTVMVDL